MVWTSAAVIRRAVLNLKWNNIHSSALVYLSKHNVTRPTRVFPQSYPRKISFVMSFFDLLTLRGMVYNKKETVSKVVLGT